MTQIRGFRALHRGEVLRHLDHARRRIELDVDVHHIAAVDLRACTVLGADPTMNRPSIEATVLRYVKPLIVTRTGGRLPAPRPATTVDGTSMPVAVLPACSTVVRNLIRRSP
jgi:hypothetical protein